MRKILLGVAVALVFLVLGMHSPSQALAPKRVVAPSASVVPARHRELRQRGW